MELAIQFSLEESRRAGSSRSRTQNGADDKDLASLDDEIAGVEGQITSLQALLQYLKRQRDEKIREIRGAKTLAVTSDRTHTSVGKIDYRGKFEWTGALYDKLKKVFGFDAFRSCQER